MHQSFLSNRTNAPRSGQIHAHGPCFPPATSGSSSGFSMRYNHPMAWTASFSQDERRVTVKRPSGSHIYFKAETGSSDASPIGSSRKLDYRVRLLNQDLTPNQQGMPSYMDMTLPSGMSLRFSAATGEVVSVTSSSGHVMTAEEYARKGPSGLQPGRLSQQRLFPGSGADAKHSRKQQPHPGVVRSRECFCLP